MGSKASASHSVRPAALHDAAEIARLTTELGYPAKAPEMAQRLRVFLAQPNHFVAVVAERETHLLGWIGVERRVSLHDDARAEIIGLVVSEEARRRGIGQLLVSAAERWAGELGLACIVVRSSVARPESHPFYEKRGYHRVKTQHVYRKSLG